MAKKASAKRVTAGSSKASLLPAYPMHNRLLPVPFVSGPLQPSAPNAPPHSSAPSFPELPAVPTNLPSVPTNSLPGENSAGGEDVDFDDLTRRFEDLKKKK